MDPQRVVAKYLSAAKPPSAPVKGEWRYMGRPAWTATSGAYGTVGVYALIRYTPGVTKDMFAKAKEDFLKQALPIAKAKGIPALKFSVGFPTRYNGYETQAFWYSR